MTVPRRLTIDRDAYATHIAQQQRDRRDNITLRADLAKYAKLLADSYRQVAEIREQLTKLRRDLAFNEIHLSPRQTVEECKLGINRLRDLLEQP